MRTAWWLPTPVPLQAHLLRYESLGGLAFGSVPEGGPRATLGLVRMDLSARALVLVPAPEASGTS